MGIDPPKYDFDPEIGSQFSVSEVRETSCPRGGANLFVGGMLQNVEQRAKKIEL